MTHCAELTQRITGVGSEAVSSDHERRSIQFIDEFPKHPPRRLSVFLARTLL